MNNTLRKSLAIIGGGPAALFLYKQLIHHAPTGWTVHIYEKQDCLGAGMPYSKQGANEEHVTNVSDVELPPLVSPMEKWITTAPHQLQQQYNIKAHTFNEYKVVPRLLFGAYLKAQFEQLLKQGKETGLETEVFLNCTVTDMQDDPEQQEVLVVSSKGSNRYHAAVICTGHQWPTTHEGKIPNYFDSPYPPAKLRLPVNYPVAIRGASLTAMDAIRTLARQAGAFVEKADLLEYVPHHHCSNFKLVVHSLKGLLPAIRIHFEDFNLTKEKVLSEEALQEMKAANNGFVPLDLVFDKAFKAPLRLSDPQFYDTIQHMQLEDFVEAMMNLREQLDPITLFKAEYAEAEKSIRRQQAVMWKEQLATLSFTLNYPAKHMSAEDMLRLKKSLLPLISLVIAFVPQSTARELLALHHAGVLSLVAVERDSTVTPHPEGGAVVRHTDDAGQQHSNHYQMFVDCIGQPQLSYADFPFERLRHDRSVSPATLRFSTADAAAEVAKEDPQKVMSDSHGNYYLKVPGLAINDSFQLLDRYGAANPRLYIMAVPHIGGLNPDYSGLDFCEEASGRIATALLQEQSA